MLKSLMGGIMNIIYEGLYLLNVENVGLSIIFFTIIVYCLMLPMTIKQQKFTRLSSAMNPEIQAIQKKYQDKKDQASMMKMQEETKMIYTKYGTSPTGGCLVTLIQFPILFALYPVIRAVHNYVDKVGSVYNKIADAILNASNKDAILNSIGIESTKKAEIADALYVLEPDKWNIVKEQIPNAVDHINKANEMNRFLWIENIAETPGHMFTEAWNTMKDSGFSGAVLVALIIAISIPVLSALSQWISMKLSQNMQKNNGNKQAENQTMNQMNMMMNMMPLLSLVMCFSLPSGLGIYWVASAVVRTIQQIIINKSLSRKPLEVLVEENLKKAEKKAAKKKAVAPSVVNQRATQSTKRITSDYQGDTYRSDAKPGSLASKANLVSDFNKRNNK